jgi:hypothetical protein
MERQDFELMFRWTKPQEGFMWEDCEVCKRLIGEPEDAISVPSGPYLVERDYSQEFYPWSPFDDSALFANFADIPATDDSFCEWASEYGRLTDGEKLLNGASLLVLPSNSTIAEHRGKPIHHLGIVVGEKRCYAQRGESRAFWHTEHFALAFASMVWEFLANNDIESLKKVVFWQNTKSARVVKFRRELLGEIDTSTAGELHYPMEHAKSIGWETLFDGDNNVRAWAPQRFLYPDVLAPARLFVQLEINKKLRDFPLQIALTLDEHGDLRKRMYPTSLLSAMWYQMYLALVGEIKLRRCSICGKWEDMKGHRTTWETHKVCASTKRVQRFRAAK